MTTILPLIHSHIENKRDRWLVSASGRVLLSRAPLSVHYGQHAEQDTHMSSTFSGSGSGTGELG